MKRHAAMNRIYRLVWSKVRNAWVAVAENARGRGKGTNRSKLIVAALSLSATVAHAAPSGGQIVAGAGSISQTGSTTTIQQSSQNLSLNWQSFNVAKQETVSFRQPSAAAIAVNRIFDTNGSQILGRLNANGQVWLINPNGILFGQGAQVNVGGLVASTLDINDASLNGNTRTFSGNGTGSVINQGAINAAEGGYVALLGNHVGNQGVITAKLGTVALGAGSAATLTFNGNNLLHMQVDQSTLNNLAENGGLIRADGGQVIMTAGAKNALLASVVNNTGVIEARTVENRNGTIILLGGMQAGTANVGGTLDASALLPSPASGGGAGGEGNGGFIETSAAHVNIADTARVTTASSMGLAGTWLIDPVDFTIAASGGNMTGAALTLALDPTTGGNVTIQSSSGTVGTAGDVNVNDVVTWSANKLTLNAQNNININAVMNGSGSASLALEYGQASTGGGSSTYNVNAAVNLPAGNNFSTKLGSNGVATNYTVITSLGAAGSVTRADLQGMNGGLALNYALGANIAASATSGWNAGAGFMPVGNSTTPFTGKFDGLGHTISSLFINRPTTNNVGLFGVTGGGFTIQNVGVAGGSVTGAYYAGGLVGLKSFGTIINSYATGSVSGARGIGGLVGRSISGTVSNSYATGSVSCTTYCSGYFGGLMGFNYGPGNVSNSYATGSVNAAGLSYVGGLVGANYGTINNSYATGSVSGGNSVGGLVGRSFSTVSNSYATGSVNGVTSVGGLVGMSYGTASNSYATGNIIGTGDLIGGLVGRNSGSVSNSYATGNVASSYYGIGGLVGGNFGSVSNAYAIGGVTGGTHVGGLVGHNAAGAVVSRTYATGRVTGSSFVGGVVGAVWNASWPSNSYWNITTSGVVVGIGGGGAQTGTTGLTTTQMQSASSFTGFNFTATPGAAGNNWVMVDANGTLNNASGAAGATFPMLASEYSTTINNAHQLQLMEMALGASYTLGSNIDASKTATSTDVWGSSGFVPVGNSITNFTGTFDGLNHTISGLTINRTATDNVGLFGYTFTGTAIRNIGLIGGSVSGGWYVGGLVGWNTSTISNSYATGSVSGATFVGGLVGYNNGSTVSNSYATGSVIGAAGVGGLVGVNDAASTISNSYAMGNVSVTVGVGGGLVGANLTSSTISNNYATGNVSGTGTAKVGGLVGNNNTGSTISNSYATGSVSGASNIGGLLAMNTGTVTSSFWNITTSGLAVGIGGAGAVQTGTTSLTTAQMQQFSSFSAWNTATPYTIANTGGSGAVWRIYEGHTYPLLTSFLAPLTLTGAPDAAVTYNGAAQSGGAFTLIPNVLGAAATGTNVGFYNGYYSTQQGYDLSGGNLTINPAALSAISLSGTRAYDGTVNVDASIFTLSGLIGSQTLTLTGVGTVADKNVGVNKPVTLGTLALGDGTGLASNYTFTGGTQVATITAAPLTLSTSAVTKTYDGGLTAAGVATVTGGTLFSGDTLSGGTFAFTDKNVGSANKVVTVSGITVNDGNGGGNYTVSYANNTTSTITQLASVAWTGGATGNWSNAANWAGGAIPDGANVAAVTIPSGVTVTYDSGVSGTTTLNTLTSNGNFTMAAGTLATSGNLSTVGYQQTGGTLNVGGNMSVTQSFAKASGATGSLTMAGGSITQSTGDLVINDGISWTTNKLTLNAQNNININGTMNGSGTAQLELDYGQGAVAAGNLGDVIVLAPINLPAGPNFSTKLGSDGTVKNYIVITSLGAAGSTTATDLQGMSGNLAGRYALGANIDASATSTWNAGAGFAPIGIFTGTFDGLGHTVTNLTINRPATGNVGLFGRTSGALIRNIGLVGGSVSGLIYVGGLVGGSNGGTISDSYFTGSVSGNYGAGGLVGENTGAISNSYATGSVSGTSGVGGLVGGNYGGACMVSNSYATGSVTQSGGFGYAGGLVGYNDGAVNNSYATGSVTGSGLIGGLVGFNYGGTVNNSFWDTQTSGIATSSGGRGLTTAQLMTKANFISATPANGNVNPKWDFTNTWDIADGSSRPFLKSHGINVVGVCLGVCWDGGAGTINWTDAANWSADSLPGSTDMVYLNLAGGATINLANSSQIIKGLNSSANNNLTISNVTLTLNNASITSRLLGSLTLNGGALTAKGALNLGASPTLSAGGKINLPGSASLTIAGKVYTIINSLGSAGSTIATDLQGMNGRLSGRYALGSDIDATATAAWNAGVGFTPIGNYTTNFTGIFDGLGHTISNLTINLPTTNYIGLFGVTGAASAIRNVGLTGGSVNGFNFVGGLTGWNSGSISNSYATGSVSGGQNSSFTQAGGLVGINAGTISNSYATGNVNWSGSNSDIGGLVGANTLTSTGTGTISNSHATGSVSGSSSNNNVGGLVGRSNGSGSSVGNSYATGSVSGGSSSLVGGLVGRNYYGSIGNSYATGGVSGGGSSLVGGLVGFNSYGTVSNNYAAGSVTGGIFSTVGGLVGHNLNGVISNGYWNNTVNATLSGIGGGTLTGATGLTTAQMQTAANFAGFNFTTTPGAAGWVIVDADGTLNNAGGALGATFPMLASEYSTTINNAHQLQLMEMAPAATYTLGSNIDASKTATSTDVWGSAGFVPIGNSTTKFTGTFDGLNRTISNLTINRSSVSGVGLFGYTGNGAAIRDVGLLGGSVSGNWSNGVGGMVGMNYGTISNSYATGSVMIGGGRYIGGLVGWNQGAVSNSYATGSVSGSSDVGGLAGITRSMVSNSYATGNVSGNSSVGGLAGQSSGVVSNSYATGSVSGSLTTGGLVGINSNGTVTNSYATGSVSGNGNANSHDFGGLVGWSNFGTISNSYAIGSVGGAGYRFGGLVGYQYYATISNSFWNTTTSGLATSSGGTGLTTADMMKLSSFSNWNTATPNTIASTGGSGATWRIYEGHTYPLLTSFLTPLTVTADNVTKTYDGSVVTGLTNASYSATGANSSGHIPNVANPYNGAVNVGSYTPGLYSDQQGYDISYVNGTLTINPAALSAISLSGTRAYDGTVNVDASIFTISGLIGSQTLTLTGVGTIADKNVGVNKPVTLGTLALGDGTGLASNYTFTGGTPVATITAAPLTLSTGNVSKTYDGGLTAAGVATVTGGTLFSGDTLSGGTFAFTDKNVGSANKTVTVSGITVNDGNGGGNYTVSYANNTTSTIIARALTVTATGVNRTYDGTTNAAVTLSDNRITGDVLNDAYTAASFADKSAASGKTVNVSGIGITGADAGNYTLGNTTATTTADIARAALTVSAAGVNRTYDGTTNATVTLSDNRISGDALTDTYTTASFLDKNAASGKTVSVSGIGIGGADANNYALGNTTASTTADIAARALTVSAAGVNRTYDGTTIATVTLSDNRISGDALTDTYTTASFLDKNAASGKTVNVSGIGISGTDANNYTLGNTTASTTAGITPATISAATGITAASKVYDATQIAMLNMAGAAFAGMVAGDALNVAAATGAFSDKNAATGKVVNVTGITLGGADAGNYTLANTTATTTADIARAALTVSGITASNKVYDGTIAATLGGTATVVSLGSDVVSVGGAGSGVFGDANVGTGKAVVVSGFTLNGTDAGNYSIVQPAGVAANITSPTLNPGTSPEPVQNASARPAPDALSPKTVAKPEAPSASPTITVMQSSSFDIDAGGGTPSPGSISSINLMLSLHPSSAGGDASSPDPKNDVVVNTTMNIERMGPKLKIVNGGMRLPKHMMGNKYD